MATTKKFARLGGSAVTQFEWQGDVIAFAKQVSIQSPAPVAQTVPIHPLNNRHPVELITPLAATMGSIQLELTDLFGEKAWERLKFLSGSQDIVDIFEAVAVQNATNAPIFIAKVITPKGNRGGILRENYHNCVVSTVQDDETIQVGTMEVLKNILVNFTHSTWSVS
jgi:hypothetical protein